MKNYILYSTIGRIKSALNYLFKHPVPPSFFKLHYLCDSPVFLSAPVCLNTLFGTWSLAEHSIFHDAATLRSCFDTPLSQHERIATHFHCQSFFCCCCLFSFSCFLFSLSLPLSLCHCESTACKLWQLKTHP